MTEKQLLLQRTKLLLAVAALVFVSTLIMTAPASFLSLFVDFEKNRISYSDIQGRVWKGEIKDASVAGAPLGDVAFQISPLSLLRFSPVVSLSATDGAIEGAGRISARPGQALTLRDVSADIQLAAVAPRGVFGEPAFGLAKVQIERVSLTRNEGCIAADGTLWTDVLDAPAKRFDLPALPMSGGFTCDEGDLVINLAGDNNRAGAEIVVRIDRTFAYEISATARPAEESVASALRIFGFEDEGGVLVYGSTGVFRGAGS